MTNTLREKHWDNIFKNKDYTQVLWHQRNPRKSYELIEKYSNKDAKILDAGSGISFLVNILMEEGYKNITLLDVSKTSLEIVKKRLKNNAVQFVCDDILNFTTEKKFDIWHDRAVFHFLTSQKERQRYFATLINSLKSEAIAIISTFRVNGPIQCAGLDTVQYNAMKMQNELPSELKLIESEEYIHITPKETEQEYIYFVIQKSS